MQSQSIREQKGQAIAQLGCIKRIDEHTYIVKSQSGNGDYDVISTAIGWKCSCPDHIHRGVICKHINSVFFSFQLRKNVEAETVTIQPISISSCPECKSEDIIRRGIRRNKSG